MAYKEQLYAPKSLYIHVPFCKAKCLYCDFVSFAGRDVRQADYFTALRNELKALAEHLSAEGLLSQLDTLYFGGGTPSSVAATELTKTVELVRSLWGFAEHPEVTIEVNPGTCDTDGLKMLFDAGVNRLSIGLQTASDRLLRKIGRIHTAKDFQDTVEEAKKIGFTNLSGDLMTGLPGQTLEDVAETVHFMRALGLKNVSFYALIVEEGSVFGRMEKEGRLNDLPDEDTEREMYELAHRLLREDGFRQYEVSNAAIPGYEGRHNLVYWQGLPYAAAGLGAAAYLGGIRYMNTDDLEAYISLYQDEANAPKAFAAAVEQIVIDEEEAMKEYFLLGFRLLKGVDLSLFEERFGKELPQPIRESLDSLLEQGLIQRQETPHEVYALTRRGLDLANFVFMEFV